MEALTKFAKSDLNQARKRGEILVAQTKRGTVSLRYADGTYTLTTQGTAPEVLASGKAATVVPVLVSLYDVVAA
jgi:hypothetical protein